MEIVVPCNYAGKCHYYQQVALTSEIIDLAQNFCESNFRSCARYQFFHKDRTVPKNLLPDSTVICPVDDTTTS